MQMFPHRKGLVLVAVFGFVLTLAASADAQSFLRGKVTDFWDNPLEGVSVLAEPEGSLGRTVTETSDEDGEFYFSGLRGDYSFTATLDGYQGLRQIGTVGGTSRNELGRLDFQMPGVATGGRFREEIEFEAGDGAARLKFDEDGTFEFEDADGEGEGTYGIVELTAVMIVRDYDGPDDKFSVNMPVVVEFGDKMFSSLTHNGVELSKK